MQCQTLVNNIDLCLDGRARNIHLHNVTSSVLIIGILFRLSIDHLCCVQYNIIPAGVPQYITLSAALSTDHESIPVRNASLAAMHSSASGSNVIYYPT
jgi:hypothetical protein